MLTTIKKLFSFRRAWLLLLLPLSLILYELASTFPAFAEWYARYPYRVLSWAINRITGLLPFSLAEILLWLLIPGILAWLVIGIVRLCRIPQNRRRRLAGFLLTPFCAVSLLLFWFVAACGINYSRYSFAEISNLPIQDSSIDELYALNLSLAEEVSSLRQQLPEDENGVMTTAFSTGEKADQARICYDTLQENYPTLFAGYSAPKAVIASRLMSWCDITGIFIPFTFEANVNVDVPFYSQPVTMCHELSHLRGYMREDEANFIAYLACRNSQSIEFQYSGAMLAFVHANNALYSANSELAQEVYNSLYPGVQRDFAYNSAYWKQFEGPVSEISNSVNDSYLKANGQEDGVQSYGRMVDLLLADFRLRSSQEP